MSLEPGWEWVDGDDWRIDWVGKWAPSGVDAEGFVYTDSDWQSPTPFPFGHPGHPRYPQALAEPDSLFSMSQFLQHARGAKDSSGASGSNDDGTSTTVDTAADEEGSDLTGMEIRGAKAETRRRRWLRRAVWVGKQDTPRPIWEGRKD